MGDAAYEPICGIGEVQPSPMLFLPPPPPPPLPKTRGESYIPPPPPSLRSEVSKKSQMESNMESRIGARSGIGNQSDGDFIQSTKTTRGSVDNTGDAYSGNRKKKKKNRKKSFANKCCMASACLIMLMGIVSSIFMAMLVAGVIKL